MRSVDSATLDALRGSRPADFLTVWAWRDGELMVPEALPIASWTMDDAAGDSFKVTQKVSFVVMDPDGVLGAWKLDDPLSAAGTRLQVVYRVGGSGAINYAWFRITRNEPAEVVEEREIDEYGLDEPDSPLGPHRRIKFITHAAVTLDAVDLTLNVDMDEFWYPQSPSTDATYVTEFQRLTKDHFPTVIDPGITDAGVSPFLVFDRNRLEAGQDLLTRIGARYRMGGDGECHIYPAVSAPVLRIEPGNALVSVARKQVIDPLYNIWIVEGKDSGDGRPVQAVVPLESGILRWGGPHGRKPRRYSSEMITTYAQAVAYAEKMRDEFLGSLSVELVIETTPRPELQGGDFVEVGCPMAGGHLAYIPGVITAIHRAGDTTPKQTTLTVKCSYEDVTAAMARTDWAEHLTGVLPELTWDRMPGSWGTTPDMNWNDLP